MAFTPVQKLSITTGAAMVLLSAVGLVAYLSITQLVDAQQAAATTNRNIARIDRVLERTTAAEAAVRRFVSTGQASAAAAIDSAQGDVEYALDSIRAASEDHPEQRHNLDSLGPIIGAQFREIHQAQLARKKSGGNAGLQALSAGAGRRPAVLLLAQMRNEEVRVLGERSRAMASSAKATRVFVVGGSLFALVLALVALQPLRASVERRLTQRLSQARVTVTDDDEGRGPTVRSGEQDSR